MAQAVSELTNEGSQAFEAAMPTRSQLLKAETTELEIRPTACQLKAACIPADRDANGFDLAGSEANEALVRQHCRCELLKNADNVVLL
jgi:hypothetical protein